MNRGVQWIFHHLHDSRTFHFPPNKKREERKKCKVTVQSVVDDNDFTGKSKTYTDAITTSKSPIHFAILINSSSCKMSSPTPGESRESFASPVPASPASQYPFPIQDSTHAVPRRGSTQRQSTTSSVASIGGILDTAKGGQSTAAEVGQNGQHVPRSETYKYH